MANQGQANRTKPDHNIDQFPTLSEALRRLHQSGDNADERVRRLDLRFDAGGYGYYRLWAGRDEEHIVGALPIPD